MKIYKANKKGYINYIRIGFAIIPLIIFLFKKQTFLENPLISLLLFIPLILVSWIYVDTFYKIEKNELIYRSGFLRGKIEISSIKEIQKGKTMWSGTKPALAKNGLILKYNKFDEIYIAPENNDEMILDLLKRNPKIKITE